MGKKNEEQGLENFLKSDFLNELQNQTHKWIRIYGYNANNIKTQ